jgi:phage shock protein E
VKFAGLLLLLALVLAGCGPHSGRPETETAGVPGQTHEPVVIDVRTSEEYAVGHLEGALNVPLNEIEQQIASVAPGKDTPLKVHCHSGRRSAKATITLRRMGYSRVEDLGSFENARQTLNR